LVLPVPKEKYLALANFQAVLVAYTAFSNVCKNK
jgi:hypothetical protein